MFPIPSLYALWSSQASARVWCWGCPGSISIYISQISPLSIRCLFLLLIPLMLLWLCSAKRVALHWCQQRWWFSCLRMKDLILPLSEVRVTIVDTRSTNTEWSRPLKASPIDSWCQVIVAARQLLYQHSLCPLPRGALSRLNIFVTTAADFLKPEVCLYSMTLTTRIL